ncbi:hypothetical protein C3B44_02085 [Corynebacterium yudongzhengii]|uniref:Uncharacterized protein n=1 Tax=Corynebacterium yudongzhengii TaxID=2080740 RepID=A0A2U1TA16_9CORY|nr:hypothetical protein C3B44_02085 [Corynebacterium yudongzhengii]PWC02822.1 hypothetical protein DF222_00815 [Corynebacterium yudongzhengii]
MERTPGASLLLGSGAFNFASGCYTITLGQSLFEATGSVAAFLAACLLINAMLSRVERAGKAG